MLQALFTYAFPPVLILAFAGLARAIGRFWKTDRRLLIFFGLILVLAAAGLRLSRDTQSGRYILVFIPVAILFCVYGLYRNGLPAWVVRLALLGIVAAAVLKGVRYNPYSDFIRYSAGLIRQDAAACRHPSIVDFTFRERLLVHYSGIGNCRSATVFPRMATRAELPEHIEKYRYSGDVVYVVRKERRDEPPVTAEELSLPSGGEWTLLGQRYYDRRERDRMTVYKYVPHIRFPHHEPGFAGPGMHLVRNGDFENPAPAGNFPGRDILRKRGIVFFEDPARRMPSGWIPNPGQGFSQGWKGSVESVGGKEALAGKYSLRLSGGECSAYSDILGKLEGKQLTVHLLARAETGSRFGVCLYFYSGSNFFRSVYTGLVSVPGDKEISQYRLKLEVPPELVGKPFRAAILLAGGNMVFDELYLSHDTGPNRKTTAKP